jgi:predicted Rossmann-fold nucleotide-binding protein
MGRDFWQPLLDFMQDTLVARKTIDQRDLDRILVTDSPGEAVRAVTDVAMKQFGLTYGPRAKRAWMLGES